MKGKIFSESANIYQDEAKILFDYYHQAAEKIVQEEERIEKEIRILEEEKAALEQEISGLWIWFLTIILFFIYFVKKNGLQKKIDEVDARIYEFKKQHDGIFRDYKVSKLGVAYVPVADQIKYDKKSFIVDYTGKVPESEVTLQMSRRNDLLVETIGKLETLYNEAPIVEKSEDTEKIETEDYSTSIQELNQYDYLGGLERSLRTISYCMDDLDTTSVSLPLVAEDSSYLHFLNEYATKDIPATSPVIQVFDKSRYTESVDKFQELNKLKDSLSTKTQQFEDVLKSLMVTMANSVQAISALKVASVDKVILESNKILFDILKSPYNQYSPILEYEEIERIRNEKFDYSEDVQTYEPFRLKPSSRMRYNLVTRMWTSEDGNTTNMPFGVHQIYEEIVAPIVQNLMAENRIERLKIYNHIKDQKIEYLNKWHQDTDAFYRANRAESSDIINLMQESLREYVAAYNTLVSLQRTEDSMVQSKGELDSTVVNVVDNAAETLAAFEMQSQEFQKTQSSFEEYIERLKEDIDIKAEKFGHIEYYDAKLRDGYSNEVAVASSEIHGLDERRKSLASVNPLFAKTSELPPEPNVENITFEYMSLNLPTIAKNALDDLENGAASASGATQTQADMGTPAADDIIGIVDSLYENASSEEPETADDEECEEENVQDDAENIEENAENIEENDEEEYEYEEVSEEILEAKTDEELQEILEEYDLSYEENNFDRKKAIADILSIADEYEEDDEYSEESLNEMTDQELQEIMASLDIPYEEDNFDREKAIANILSTTSNN